MEQRRLELDLRAAIKRIGSLEAELIQANCVQKRYEGEKSRLQIDLTDSKPKKITSLEVKLNEANFQWKRCNSKESMLEIELRAAMMRIQSLEAELRQAAWKIYNLENRNMETDVSRHRKN
jgi:chromosome segregation ATPase